MNHLMSRYRSQHYRCHDFVREVWLELTGVDIEQYLTKLFVRQQLSHSEIRQFQILETAEDPCLVCTTQLGRDPHIGVYTSGTVLHLASKVPIRESLAQFARRGTDMRYYK